MLKQKAKTVSVSTRTGAHHWWMQRLTALGLIPLSVWLVLSVLQIAQDPSSYMPIFFAYPFNALMGILFIAVSLYHGALGMKAIIEDYVHNKFQKYLYIILINFFSIITGVAAILAILHLHLVG